MNANAFLAAVLRNPVNEAIAHELFRLAGKSLWPELTVIAAEPL
jgi:hypothetical protein